MQLRKLLDFVINQVGTNGVPNRAPDRVSRNSDGSQDYGYDESDGKTRYYNQDGKNYANGIGSMDGSEQVNPELGAIMMEQKK